MVARLSEKLPEPVRAAVSEGVAILGRELRSVRRPRDVRRLASDPEFLSRLSQPLAPVLDRVLGVVARGAVPLSPRTGAALVTLTGLAGASVDSAMEVAAALGIEVPPAAAALGGSAVAVAVGAEVAEFYLLASMIWTELRAAGRADPETLRRALLMTYLGGDVRGQVVQRSMERLALQMVKRMLPTMVPVVGIPLAGRSAWRDQRRARVAVGRILASEPPAEDVATS